ncbi:elongation factor G-2, mitochondrial [Trifolium repens]|nr:elongation factor G-2, mitochondrial [Trifolium repens]
MHANPFHIENLNKATKYLLLRCCHRHHHRQSSLPRLLYYTTTYSSPSPPPSFIASSLHLRHFSVESVERLRHVWISGLIDPDKVGPTERSTLYAGKIEEMHASLNKEQSFRDFDTIRAGITFVKWKDHKVK